jgi:hypothetical protein
VTIEYIANTLPASHILCPKFCTNGKKKREYHFTYPLVSGGGNLPNFEKEEEMYLLLPHFFLGFREKERVG